MSRLLGLLRRYRNLVLLLVSGLLLPLVTELAGSWLEATFGRTPSQLLQLLAIGVALAVGLWVLFLALQRHKVVLVPPSKQPPRMAGLVALVGRGEPRKKSARLALDYHLESKPGLQACWLIASEGTTGSMPTAMALHDQYKDRCRVEICPLRSAFDLQEVYEVVRQIYEKKVPDAGLQSSQVITDFAGGTAPMSAGAALACREGCWPMQYMTGGKEGIASVPVFVRFTPAK